MNFEDIISDFKSCDIKTMGINSTTVEKGDF